MCSNRKSCHHKDLRNVLIAAAIPVSKGKVDAILFNGVLCRESGEQGR